MASRWDVYREIDPALYRSMIVRKRCHGMGLYHSNLGNIPSAILVQLMSLSALRGNSDHAKSANRAKSANHRNYRLPGAIGRRIRRLDDETTSARASSDR